MIDPPATIDPLVAEGPRQAVDTLRPGLNLQRVLLLDEPGLLMADLATGDIRPYENGPPVAIPMVSDHFDLGAIRRLQFQVNRDPRPSSTSQTLFGLELVPRRSAVDISITPDNRLEIRGSGRASAISSSGPAGVSPAFVIVVEPGDEQLAVSVRNAETLTPIVAQFDSPPGYEGRVVVGGPSELSERPLGRRRSTPVLVEVQRRVDPVDRIRRVASEMRRVAGAARRRIG